MRESLAAAIDWRRIEDMRSSQDQPFTPWIQFLWNRVELNLVYFELIISYAMQKTDAIYFRDQIILTCNFLF